MFMHDGAPAQHVKAVRNFSDENAPHFWIERSRTIKWSPMSPDLMPSDFFLYGPSKAMCMSRKTALWTFSDVELKNHFHIWTKTLPVHVD